MNRSFFPLANFPELKYAYDALLTAHFYIKITANKASLLKTCSKRVIFNCGHKLKEWYHLTSIEFFSN